MSMPILALGLILAGFALIYVCFLWSPEHRARPAGWTRAIMDLGVITAVGLIAAGTCVMFFAVAAFSGIAFWAPVLGLFVAQPLILGRYLSVLVRMRDARRVRGGLAPIGTAPAV